MRGREAHAVGVYAGPGGVAARYAALSGAFERPCLQVCGLSQCVSPERGTRPEVAELAVVMQ